METEIMKNAKTFTILQYIAEYEKHQGYGPNPEVIENHRLACKNN